MTALSGPLSVSGAQILDAAGTPVRLAGVNWGGAQQDECVPYGLDKLNRHDIIARIAGWGLNHVRIPFALGTIVTNSGALKTAPAKASRLAANPDMQGLTPWQVYAQLVDDMTAAGLYVIPNQHLLYPGWPVPLGVQILTRSGWKSWHEVEPGIDQTLGLSDDGTLRWTPVLQVRTRAQQPVVRFGQKNGWSTVTTEDHRWLTQSRADNGTWRPEVKAMSTKQAWSGNNRLVLAAPAEGGKSECTPDEARVLAWILSDGTIGVYSGELQAWIYQSDAKFGAEVRDLILRENAGTGTSYATNSQHGQCRRYRIRTTYIRRLLLKTGIDLLDPTPFLLRLSREARAAWLETWVQAEGDERGRIAQNPGPLLDAICLAIYLEGHRPRISSNGPRCKKVTARAPTVAGHAHVRIYEPMPGLTDVWCPTTELGSWTARDENGNIFLTGNCCADTDANGFWFNDNWPSATFTNAWVTVAQQFAGNPLVGYDLHNEPRPATIGGSVRTPTWGSGGNGGFPTDFRAMYQNTIGRIRSVHPGALCFCEGLNYAGDLTGWAAHPVTGSNVVASLHDYSWFHPAGQTQASYDAQMDAAGGYLVTGGTAPLWIGEFGANTDVPLAAMRSGWLPQFISYAARRGLHWCWWELSATAVLGTEPATNTVKMQAGQREAFSLMAGQDWAGTQTDLLAMLAPVIP